MSEALEETGAGRGFSPMGYPHVTVRTSREYGDVPVLEIVTPADLVFGGLDRQRLAAVALHDTPYGFTLAMIEAMETPPAERTSEQEHLAAHGFDRLRGLRRLGDSGGAL